MDTTTNTAAATAATGSVATPASQTTPSTATGAPGGNPASTSQSVGTNRAERRTYIAELLRNPPTAPAADPATNPKPARSNPDDGSPPGTEPAGTSDDLSQQPQGDGLETQPEGSDPNRDGEGGDPDSDPDAGGQPRKQNWPKEAVERVRKLKDQRQALKADLAQRDATLNRLESEVRELRSMVQKPADAKPPAAADPLARESDPAAIQKRASEAQGVLDWADDLLDEVAADPEHVAGELESQGVKPPEGGWSEKSLRETLRTIKGNCRGVIQAAPKRLQFIQAENQSLQWAMTAKPELADPESEFAQEMRAVVAARPWIKEQPDWPILVTAALVGLRELQKRPASANPGAPAAASARPVPRAPRVPGAPRSSPAQAQGSEVDALRQKAVQKGASREDRLALISASLRQMPQTG